MNGPGPRDPQDGVYRAILMVLAASVVFGAILALLGDYYFQNESIKNVGVGAVIFSGAIYLFFRLLGRREAARRQAQQERASDQNREDDHDDGPDDDRRA